MRPRFAPLCGRGIRVFLLGERARIGARPGQLTNRERFPVFFTFQPFRLDFVGPLRSRSAANPMKFVPLPFRSFGVLLQAASLPFSFPHTRETSLRRLRPIARQADAKWREPAGVVPRLG